MYRYSKSSFEHLLTCDVRLQTLFEEVLKYRDHKILEGHRGKEKQNEYYAKGTSKVPWPKGKHNKKPSQAIDVAPYPIDWGESGTSEQRRKAIARFYEFAGYVLATADRLAIPIRWGGDWDRDLDFADQSFDDLVHYELVT